MRLKKKTAKSTTITQPIFRSSTSPTTILVSCDEFNSSYDSFSAKDFRGDLVWLVPEEALLAWDGPDRARLPLRLDSNLLSHTKYAGFPNCFFQLTMQI